MAETNDLRAIRLLLRALVCAQINDYVEAQRCLEQESMIADPGPEPSTTRPKTTATAGAQEA